METTLAPLEEIEAKLQLEALIFISGNTIDLADIQQNFKNLSQKTLIYLIKQIQTDYATRNGALELTFYSKERIGFRLRDSLHRDPMLRSFTSGREFNPIEMKTLAFIGYFQPVEKTSIIELVGRGSKKAVKNLTLRGFIHAAQEKYPVLNAKGKEIELTSELYTTTPRFADYFGIENDRDKIRQWIEKYM